jgi:Ca2+-binding RTX toxin-like protein
MPVNAGAEFPVNSYTSGFQSTYPSDGVFDSVSTDLTRPMRSIAMAANGDFVVVWSSSGQDDPSSSFQTGVYGRRYSADGTPKGAAFQINTQVKGDQAAPSVAIDAAGNFIVTWSSSAGSFQDDQSGYGVYARRYNSSGVAIDAAEFRANSTTFNNQLSSAVAMDQDNDATDPNDGGFVITWTSFGQDGSGFGVFARRFNKDGVAQGNDIAVTSVGTSLAQTIGSQLNSSVAMADDGSFVVVWESSQGDGVNSGYGVFAQRFDALGNALGDRIQINSFTAGDQRKPSVAMAADGSFVVAWSSQNQIDSAGWDVFYRRFNPDGTPATEEQQANFVSRDNQQDATVSMSANGRFIISWTSTNPQAPGAGVYARRFDASGNPPGGADGNEFRLDTGTSGTGKYSSIAASDNSFAAVWTGTDANGEGVIGRAYLIETPTTNTPPSNITLTPAAPEIAENDEGAVGGTLSAADAEGDSITFTVTGDDRFEVVGRQLKLKAGQSLDFERDTDKSIVLTITATDDGNPNLSASQSFTITTTNVNEAPPSITLSNTSLDENTPGGTLVGTLSATDPEGNSLTYAIANNPFYELRNGREVFVKEGAVLDFENATSRSVTIAVTATDNGTPPASVTQEFIITLNDVNEVPVNIQLTGNTVAENAAGAEIGTVTATDPDGTTPILSVADSRFEIVGGKLKLKTGQSLNYEALKATDGELTLEIIATDSQDASLQSRQNVTIQVTDVNEAPESISLNKQEVTENTPGAIVGTVSFVDPEGDAQTLAVVGDGRFEIDGQNNLKLRAGVQLDREAAPTINVRIRAADKNNSNLFSEQTFTITVLNQNEPPTEITLTATEVNENARGAVIGEVLATDPDSPPPALSINDTRFEIVDGKLKLKATQSLNYEELIDGKLSLTITATDSEGETLSRVFEITVRDVNEAPELTIPSAGSVPNNKSGVVVIDSIAFSDPEGDPVTLSVSDNRFEVVQVGSKWQLKLKNDRSLNFDTEPEVAVEVIASDGKLQTRKAVTIDVVPPGTPTNITLSKSTIDEATPAAVVGEVTVEDEDSTTHTFTLSDDRFEIVRVNGRYQLKLKAGQSLDFETATGAIPLEITAKDPDNREIKRSFNIEIQDINEAPTGITLENATVEEQKFGAEIGTIAVIDPDRVDSFIYTFSDDRFEVRNGKLKLKDNAQLDINDETTIDLTITARDKGELTTIRTFTITVDPVNFAPTDITIEAPINIDEDTDGAIVGKLTVVDRDRGDTHTFEIDDVRFEVDDQDNLRLKAGQQVNFETEQTIDLTITATDSENESVTKQITIEVVDLNDAPILEFEQSGSIAENAAGIAIGTLMATDPEGNALSFEISGALKDRFEIVPAQGAWQLRLKQEQSLDFETLSNGAVSLTITATDNGTPVRTTTLPLIFAVTDVNEAPTALTLEKLSVVEQQAGAAVGQVQVTDPDQNEQFRYDVNDDRFEIVNGILKLKDGVSLNADDTPTVKVTVTAFDRGDLSITREFEIEVEQINQAPTGIALDKETIDEDSPGTIVGKLTVADSDRGDTHTFEVSDDRFEVDAQGNLRLKAGVAVDFETTPSITLTITATDSGGLKTPPQTFTIAVRDLNETPTDIGLSSNTIAENAAGAIVGDLTVTDSDSTEFSFEVSDDRFEVVNGQLKLKDDQSLNFEAEETLQIEVTVFDRGTPDRTFTKEFTVNVTDVNEAPSAIQLENDSVAENSPGAIVGKLTATDPDKGDTAAFSLSGDDRFELDNEGNLKLKQGISLDFEENPSIQVTVTATDSGGLTRLQTFTIRVTNVNEPPTAIQLSNNTVAENAAGAIIGDLIVTDPDSSTFTFTVSDSTRFEVKDGKLKLKAGQRLDFESGSTLTLDVTAIDDGNPAQSFTQSLTLNITDVNEAPTEIRLLNDRVAENSAGAIVGQLEALDPDAGDRLSYQVSDNRFEIDAQGNLKLKNNQQLDRETTPTIALNITATDQGGLKKTQRFTLTVTDVNESPTSLTLTGTTVAEDASPNTPIGTFSATDNEGGSFRYSLVPGVADNSAFAIDGDRLLVKTPLDFETKNTYSIQVAVADSEGLSLTRTFQINVTNANEAPVITLTAGALAYQEGAGAVAIDPALSVVDVDSQTLSGAAVQIVNYVPQQDRLSFTNQSGISGQFDAVTGILTLSGTASISEYQKALRSIAYTNTSNAPDTTNRILQFTASDGLLTSQIATRTIQISPVNDPAVVTPSVTAVAFSPDSRAIDLDAGIQITDIDSSALNGATIALEGYVPGEDNLLFNDQNGIVGSFNAVSGVLTLSGTASISDYQQALRSVIYLNSRQQPTAQPRAAVITVSDGILSTPARIGLQYQQSVAPPMIDLNGGGAGNDFSNTFVILGQPVAVASSETRLTDSDSMTLTRAEVKISNLFDPNSETLLVDTTGTRIAANYDRPSGTLNLSGAASLSDYGKVIQRIRYQNGSAAPDMTTRVILFRVSDGTRLSNAAQTTIQMTGIRLNDGTGMGDPALVTTPATDRINAQDGNDTVVSTLANLQQNDQIDGGTGIDTLTLTDGTGNARIEIANPTNQVSGVFINNTTITNFEQFNWSGFNGSITLIGSDANDGMIAGSGADNLFGGGGNDRLIGNAGDDRLDGGTGADYLEGGAGDDFYVVDSAGDRVVELENGGFDTVSAAIDYTLPDHVEDLVLTGSARSGTGNALDNGLVGNGLDNTLNGGLGNDLLLGNDGNDTLVGEGGDDELIGGLGDDRLLGGDGNDRLEGGAGRDRLTGGKGKDVFILSSSQRSNHDVITDFNPKDDTILIRRSSFGRQLRRGRVRASQFVLGSQAQDASDRFIYSKGALFFDIDGSGDANQVLIARLIGRPTITRSDLRVIQ